MLTNLIKEYAQKQHPLATVTWGDITRLVDTVQGPIPAIDAISSPVILNKREREFIQYIAKDMETKEIAQIMGKSHRTVEDLRGKIRKKVGAKSNVGLVLYAINAGLIRVQGPKTEESK